MKKWTRRILCLAVILGLLAGMPVALAAEPEITGNMQAHNYVNAARWPMPSYSNLSYDEAAGIYTRVEYPEYGADHIFVERYDSTLNFLDRKNLALELPVYGGAYCGKNHYFLVFGQENPGQDDTREVIRVVKYDKNWNRLGSASLCGANTTKPFNAGSVDLYEYEGYLYLRTAHEMYQSADGLNHQANLTMNIRISDMKITDSVSGVVSKVGYVSHSFNQYIRVDEADGTLVALDHGDAYPRSVVLNKYYTKAGKDTFTDTVKVPATEYGPGWYYNAAAEDLDVLLIAGSIGDNDTGVSTGGFEISDSAYLSVGISVDQDPAVYRYNAQRNVYLTVTAKDLSETRTVWLTDLQGEEKIYVDNPFLVKISDNRFLILWSQGRFNVTMHHVFVDGEGNLLTQEYVQETGSSWLSDCQPIVAEGRVVWYMTDWEQLRFFAIDADLGGRIQVLEQGAAQPEPSEPSEPTEPSQPSEPSEPTEPSQPSEPSEPTEPSQPGEPSEPTEPSQPTEPEEPDSPNPFVDVAEGKFYYEPVLWAVENEITKGVDDTHFGPMDGCSRAHVVTFLWRAAGSPEPESRANPFTDVPEGKFYYKAVLWAVENQITNGISATEFAPDQTCNRGQIVTFLWRYAGKPGAGSAGTAFTDVKADAFYTNAVAWAVEAGVTNGMGEGKFAPNDTCTRGQVVTFLKRTVS